MYTGIEAMIGVTAITIGGAGGIATGTDNSRGSLVKKNPENPCRVTTSVTDEALSCFGALSSIATMP
jgi:hypothetical protein